jgi:hypothetical protein
LGDPWTGRWFGSLGFRLGLLCSCLADGPPIGHGQSTWRQLSWCSSCSSLVLERLSFDPIFQLFSVAGGLADGLPRIRGQSAWGELVVDGPRCLHERSVIFAAILEGCESFSDSPPLPCGLSAVCSRTVRPELADNPPGTAQGC